VALVVRRAPVCIPHAKRGRQLPPPLLLLTLAVTLQGRRGVPDPQRQVLLPAAAGAALCDLFEV
jgi:hypothetical protein